MKKRIIGILFTAVLGLLLGVAVAGCGEKVDRASLPGGFYTLQEAYEGGYITRADLKEIAERQNNGTYVSEEELDAQIKQQILEDRAEWLRNLEEHPIPEAEASGVRIVHYYGVYQGDCYAVMLSSIYEPAFPAVEEEQWEHIGGVDILYLNPRRIEIWKKN